MKSIFRLLIVKCIFVFLLAGINKNLYAQETLNLSEITVKGVRPERFMVGQKIQDIDSASLNRNTFTNLSNFLQFQAPVAFRSYGAGQLATISFRGTSGNHTALLWNGININFPSLGLVDYSTIPVAGFDQMTIQYGSAASVVGSDAVGGSIQLRSMPDFRAEGLQGITALNIESNKNISGQLGTRYYKKLNEKWKLGGKTLVYSNIIKNDFGTLPITNNKGESYNLEPIQNIQSGLVQDVFFQHKNGDLLSLNAWLTGNNLIIQPANIELREITNTKATRLQASYQLGNTLIRGAFIRDITDFGRAENLNPSHTRVDRYLARIEHDFSWVINRSKGVNLKVGAEAVHFNAEVDGYGNDTKTENRYDIYALLRVQFNDKLSSSLNLRQAFITKYNPPFTPSLGIEYQLYSHEKTKITLPVSFAFSYRVPTLNERYWVNLGNPDLKPEQGFNKEAGIRWQQKISEKTQSKVEFTAFHNFIKNWTYWNPDRGYRVENLQEVLSKGLEIDFNLKTEIHKSIFNFNAQYALTNVSQQKEYGPYTKEIINKQLIYVPRHVVSSSVSFKKNNFNLSLQQSFNSARYITFDHSGSPFPPFYLLNANFGYKHKQLFDLMLQGNNLTNSLYPNIKKNAMPMRSISLSFIFHFQNKKTI